MNEYDNLATIYEIWSSGDPSYIPSHDFYVQFCCKDFQEIVEIGIGTGRIAIDIAKSGKKVTGIDISSEMLSRCRENIKCVGIDKQISLIQSDVREFKLPKPAEFIIFPFRSIGHLLTLEDKKTALSQIFKNLIPGGICIFDHYIFDEKWAKTYNNTPRLTCAQFSPGQKGLFIWDLYQYDFPSQQMKCFIIVEQTNENGQIVKKTYNPLSFSWIAPDQIQNIVTEIGFSIDAVYGDFSFGELNENSENQIWVLKRPF